MPIAYGRSVANGKGGHPAAPCMFAIA